MDESYQVYKSQANYIEACGHQIAYWRSTLGAVNQRKPVILFIHGFPSASWDWHYQWAHLAQDYHLVAADLLGFGLSDKPQKHRYSLLEQADILESLLSQLHIDNCHILAHDYGDSVAQELLSRQPRAGLQISSICFLNGGLFASHHRPLLTQKLLKGPLGSIFAALMSKTTLAKGFTKIFGQNTPPKPEEINVLWQLIEYNQGKKVIPRLLKYIDERPIHNERWINHMNDTDIPLYFINGVLDPISGQHMLDHYESVIPNPKTTALELGHYPQLEAPHIVLNLYSEFLHSLAN